MQTTGLRYFLMVARAGSITAAAERLNVAASAISRQITNLETDLDCVLFERRPRGMVLSPAGELLAEHAQRVLVGTHQVATEIRELKGLTRGFIRLASSEGFALELLPRAIQTFQQRHPGIRFELAVGPPAQVTRQVECGDVDIGLTFPIITTTSVDIIYQALVEMVVIASSRHPLAGNEEICLADLRSYPVALTTHDTTSRLTFEAACLDEGISIEPVLTANILATLIPYVLEGHALVPMSALSIGARIRSGSIVALPLRTRVSSVRRIQIQTMRERKLPHACRSFISHLMELLPPAAKL